MLRRIQKKREEAIESSTAVVKDLVAAAADDDECNADVAPSGNSYERWKVEYLDEIDAQEQEKEERKRKRKKDDSKPAKRKWKGTVSTVHVSVDRIHFLKEQVKEGDEGRAFGR